MSFKERLQEVTSESELHKVMRELWAFGSRNWTQDSVVRYAPAEFSNALDPYFDEQGHLLDRFPDDLHSGLSVPSPTPSARSLSELISTFHGQLFAIRSGTCSRSRTPRQQSLFYDKSDEGAEPLHTAATPTRTVLPEPTFLEFVNTPEPGFLCPICDKRTEMEPIYFRNVEMCRPCAAKLR